jgi:hypothetical protein
VLLPALIARANDTLGEPIVAGIPHRDALLVAPAAHRGALERLVAEEMRRAPHPITDRLIDRPAELLRDR